MTDRLDVMQALDSWDRAAWCLAALALAMEGGQESALTRAAGEVLAAVGVVDEPGKPPHGTDALAMPSLGSQAAASLHKTSSLLRAGRVDWRAQSDEALLAQGRASAQGARGFAEFGMPRPGPGAGPGPADDRLEHRAGPRCGS